MWMGDGDALQRNVFINNSRDGAAFCRRKIMGCTAPEMIDIEVIHQEL